MEWLADPNIWIGLATLIALEIVLGLDNLVFIAILAEKLPPQQRNRARITGLALALVMRLVLLASITWIVTLTRPLFELLGRGFSGRDLVLIIGGIFLLAKGTLELHERLEGGHKPKGGNVEYAVFWQVIVQIVVLDAVFSLDSIITAVGMVDELAVMIAAVIIAMGVMMLASKPLMNFIGKHPTVVILCLGFLLLIGFSLIIEGFGYEIPKGYLYAAIGFSVLVEAANQLGRRNRERLVTVGVLRERTSEAVLRLLGGRTGDSALSETVDVIAEQTSTADIFRQEEKEMIRAVLDLGERPVASIMSTRGEIEWIDMSASEPEIRADVLALTHSRVILSRGTIDDFVGVAITKELMNVLLTGETIDWSRVTRQPVVVHESTRVLRVMEQLRGSPVQMAIVVDEYGSFEGIATPTDVLEAIAGEFPDLGDEAAVADRQPDGAWLADGFIDIRQLSAAIDQDLVSDKNQYATLGGYIVNRLGHLPAVGERLRTDALSFEILSLDGRSIGKVRIAELDG